MNIPGIQLSWMVLEAKESLEKTRETLFYSQKCPSDTQDNMLKQVDDAKGTKEPAAHNDPSTRVEPNLTTELTIGSNPSMSSAVTPTTQVPTPVVGSPSSAVGVLPSEPHNEMAIPIEPAQEGKTDQINNATDIDTHAAQVTIPPAESSSEPDDKATTPAEPVQVGNAGEALLDPNPMMSSDVLEEWKCGRCSKPVQDEKTLRRCFRHSCRGMSFQVFSSTQDDTNRIYRPDYLVCSECVKDQTDKPEDEHKWWHTLLVFRRNVILAEPQQPHKDVTKAEDASDSVHARLSTMEANLNARCDSIEEKVIAKLEERLDGVEVRLSNLEGHMEDLKKLLGILVGQASGR